MYIQEMSRGNLNGLMLKIVFALHQNVGQRMHMYMS